MPLKRCQFCLKAFPTQRAVNQHISASKICIEEWHKKIIRKNINPSPKRRRIYSPEPSFLDDLPNADLMDILNDADDFLEPGQQTPSHRATVEVGDDNEDDYNPTPLRYVEPFPGPAGEPLRREKTRFEMLQEIQKSEEKSPWEPFSSREEWGLAEWLMKNVGQKSTNEYLQLPIVSQCFCFKKNSQYFKGKQLQKPIIP
jgi:hypothetical protein